MAWRPAHGSIHRSTAKRKMAAGTRHLACQILDACPAGSGSWRRHKPTWRAAQHGHTHTHTLDCSGKSLGGFSVMSHTGQRQRWLKAAILKFLHPDQGCEDERHKCTGRSDTAQTLNALHPDATIGSTMAPIRKYDVRMWMAARNTSKQQGPNLTKRTEVICCKGCKLAQFDQPCSEVSRSQPRFS